MIGVKGAALSFRSTGPGRDELGPGYRFPGTQRRRGRDESGKKDDRSTAVGVCKRDPNEGTNAGESCLLKSVSWLD